MGWGLFWGGLALSFVILWFGYDLPNIDHCDQIQNRPSIRIFDKKGTLLGTYGNDHGFYIPANKMPIYLIQALLATEDRRFFQHWGIDPFGLARAATANYKKGSVVQGGSTITQQLAKHILQEKNIFGPYDRSLKRKIMEALLAFRIELKYSKPQILEMYLNRVYFGAGAYGVDGAARVYFNKPAQDLGLYESAILVGLLRAPARYSPTGNTQRSEARASHVLERMIKESYITPKKAKLAMAMPTLLQRPSSENKGRYFADWIFEKLPSLLNSDEDLDVITTLDSDLQAEAEEKARLAYEKDQNAWGASQLSLVALKPDGAIAAMVGGVDYKTSKFNRATQALRQSGSVFKYFVFLKALEDGFQPDSLISDTPFEYQGWKFNNYKYKASGETTLRNGFAKSINAVAVRLAVECKIRPIIQLAKSMGIHSPLREDMTLALGSGETTLLDLTASVGAIESDGYLVEPYGVQSIYSRSGELLYQHKPTKTLMLDHQIVKEMKDLMRATVQWGTGRRVGKGVPQAIGKTGTSQNYRDIWFVGSFPGLIVGAWGGNDNFSPLNYHSQMAASHVLWNSFSKAAYETIHQVKLDKDESQDKSLEEADQAEELEEDEEMDDAPPPPTREYQSPPKFLEEDLSEEAEEGSTEEIEEEEAEGAVEDQEADEAVEGETDEDITNTAREEEEEEAEGESLEGKSPPTGGQGPLLIS